MLLFFFLGGLLGTGLGMWLLLGARALKQRGVVTQGRYVDAQWGSVSGGTRATQYGVVEFLTPQGQPIRFESRLGTLSAGSKVGQPVPVIYDPQQPQKAVVYTFLEFWMPTVIALTVGISWLLVSSVLMIVL